METQIITLLLGFVLTTVGGGLLGYFFQNRSWKHQNTGKLSEVERATATKIFESISTLMDKRLYRMRLLSWSLANNAADIEGVEEQRKAYRQVLLEWNETLIRNLALTQAYFGDNVRNNLEGTIYEEFRQIGSLLEQQYRELKEQGRLAEPASLDKELNNLSDSMYQLNFQMINLIQKGQVGIFNSDKPH